MQKLRNWNLCGISHYGEEKIIVSSEKVKMQFHDAGEAAEEPDLTETSGADSSSVAAENKESGQTTKPRKKLNLSIH